MTRAFHTDLGKVDYKTFMEMQEQLLNLRRDGNAPDIVLFAEHSPALLFGRKVTSFSHESIKAAQAAKKHPFDHAKDSGLSVHHTDYSSATYAGPGQMAVCVLSDYTRLLRPQDVNGYNAMLDNIIMHSLESLGIRPELRKHITADVGGSSHRIAGRAAKLGPMVAAGSMHLHVTAQSTKHFGMLSGNDLFTSAEEVLGYAPSREEVKTAILRSVEKHMKYDKIDECTISQNEHGLLVKKV